MKNIVFTLIVVLFTFNINAQIKSSSQPDLNINYSYQYVVSDGAIFPEEKQDILITLNFGADDYILISFGYNYTEKLKKVTGWTVGLIEPISGKKYSSAKYRRIQKGDYIVTVMYMDDSSMLILHDEKMNIKTIYTNKPLQSNVDMNNFGL